MPTSEKISAPELAVVIPVYNRAELVKRTLQSVLDQSVLPGRLVLVDNHSTDSSLSVLRQWAEANNGLGGMQVIVTEEPTPGAAAARNAGLALVEEPWVMHFDSDDTMLPSHISRAVEAIRNRPQAQIVGWDVVEIHADGRRRVLPFYSSDCLFHCVMHGMMASLRYAARTSLVRTAGGWNPQMLTWDDVELGLRMLTAMPAAGEVAKVEGEPTVCVYVQTESITGTSFSQRADHIERALEAMTRTLAPEQRWLTRLRSAILCGHYRREGAHSRAQALMKRTLAAEPSLRGRLLLKFAAAYTAAGGRGAARLVRPLYPHA